VLKRFIEHRSHRRPVGRVSARSEQCGPQEWRVCSGLDAVIHAATITAARPTKSSRERHLPAAPAREPGRVGRGVFVNTDSFTKTRPTMRTCRPTRPRSAFSTGPAGRGRQRRGFRQHAFPNTPTVPVTGTTSRPAHDSRLPGRKPEIDHAGRTAARFVRGRRRGRLLQAVLRRGRPRSVPQVGTGRATTIGGDGRDDPSCQQQLLAAELAPCRTSTK
jgi:hypothetical protein